jgi:hypothetical protein
MSLSELRKELKEARKAAMPVPVSRMKKADCAAELERIKSIHKGEEKKVAAVLKSADVPTKVAKTVKAVQEKEHGKVHKEEVVKTTKPKLKAAPAEEKPKAKKVEKGSQEAKDRMAALRAMRMAKKKDE